MRTLLASLLVCLSGALYASAAEIQTEQAIHSVFSGLRNLKPMQAGQSYTVRVGGNDEAGLKEKFLRRRTALEIEESGLSCGCGDYAILFIEHIEPLGFSSLLVDGAEISSESLQNHFSGHAVVAIRDKEAASDAPWWLVDSTNLKIISRDWLPTSKKFQAFGRIFWIGYCGPLKGYPVHDADALKVFYTRTLAAVPLEFYNASFCRLNFTVDSSLIDPGKKFLNPRLAKFLQLQTRLFAAYCIEPKQEVSILLTRGSDSSTSELKGSRSAGWVGHIGLQSGCSVGLLSYFERIVARQESPKEY